MRIPLALFAMLGFVLSTVLGLGPTTRAGVQCPTATVQTVTVRDCCGRLVTRAPRPGEKAFKQCRCAEKKSESQNATLATKVVLFLETAEPFRIAPRRENARRIPTATAGLVSRLAPPRVRPPASV